MHYITKFRIILKYKALTLKLVNIYNGLQMLKLRFEE